MIVHILSEVGGRPICLEASQVLVCFDDGTPASVSASFGQGQICTAKAGDADFNATLNTLGVRQTVVCENATPIPLDPRARRVAGPK